MAGIAKIVGKAIDDVAKVMTKVLIGLGDAVAGDVKSGKTFYAGSTTLKTGTMPTKAIVAANDLYEEGYHAGNPGGLDAIDTDLAPANIKKDVNIFGKVGTFVSTLAEDILGSAQSTITEITTSALLDQYYWLLMGAGADITIATKTQTYDASSMAVAVAMGTLWCNAADSQKPRLFMNSVQVAEGGYLLAAFASGAFTILIGTRALSGSVTCEFKSHSYAGGNTVIDIDGSVHADKVSAGIAIGSIKI